jgi:hypothetical protein
MVNWVKKLFKYIKKDTENVIKELKEWHMEEIQIKMMVRDLDKNAPNRSEVKEVEIICQAKSLHALTRLKVWVRYLTKFLF